MTKKLESQLLSKSTTEYFLFYFLGCKNDKDIILKFKKLSIEAKKTQPYATRDGKKTNIKMQLPITTSNFYMTKYYKGKLNYIEEGYLKKTKQVSQGTSNGYEINIELFIELILKQIELVFMKNDNQVVNLKGEGLEEIHQKEINKIVDKNSDYKEKNKELVVNYYEMEAELKHYENSDSFIIKRRTDALDELNDLRTKLDNPLIIVYLLQSFSNYIELFILNWLKGAIREFTFYEVLNGYLNGISKLLTHITKNYADSKKSKFENKDVRKFKLAFKKTMEYYDYFNNNNQLSHIAEWSSYPEYVDEKVKN